MFHHVVAVSSMFLVSCMSRAEIFDHPRFSKWVEEGKAPVIPSMLKLVNTLQEDNWGIVFMTGRIESQRNITIENLFAAGFASWTDLILRLVLDSQAWFILIVQLIALISMTERRYR